MLEDEIKKNQSKKILQGKKNTIKKRLDLIGKKTNEWWNCQKILQKPYKKIAIKKTETKSDRWKYLLGWN